MPQGDASGATPGFRGVIARAVDNPFMRRVAALAGGAVTAQVVTLLAMPVLARLYSPQDFGSFGVFVSVLGIAVCLATLQYENAIPLPRSHRVGANLLAASLAVLLAMSLLFTGLVVLVEVWAGHLSAVQTLRPVLWLLPLTFLATGLYLALLGWALRLGNFRVMAASRVTQSGVVALVQIGLGLAGATAIGLALGNALGWAVSALVLASATWYIQRPMLSGISTGGMRRAMARYRKFPLISSFSAILEMIQIQAPVLLVSMLYGVGVGGLFLMANRVALLPVNMLALSVSQVMIREAVGDARSPKVLARVLPRVLAGLVLVGGVIAGGAAVAGPVVFTLIFGREWTEAGFFVRALAPLLLAQFVVIPLNSVLLTRERQGLLIASHGGRVLVLVVVLLCCHWAGIAVRDMVLIYALTQAGAYAVTLGIIWRVGRAGLATTVVAAPRP